MEVADHRVTVRLGVSLLAVVLLGPIVQPWYLMWGIAVLAITAGARTAAAIALLSVVVSLVGVVGLGQLTTEFASLGLLYQLLFVLTLAAAVVVPIRTVTGHENSAMVSHNRGRWSLARVWTCKGPNFRVLANGGPTLLGSARTA